MAKAEAEEDGPMEDPSKKPEKSVAAIGIAAELLRAAGARWLPQRVPRALH